MPKVSGIMCFARGDEVSTVTVTGFNEWIAIKLILDGRVGFVDTADEEFSRDIEPPKGDGYQDAFYLQLCDNIRRFKGIKGICQSPRLNRCPLPRPGRMGGLRRVRLRRFGACPLLGGRWSKPAL